MKSFVLAILATLLAIVTAHAEAFEQVRVISSTDQGIRAEVLFPEASVLPDAMHPGYQAIVVGAMPVIADPGEPRFPRASFWVAVPPGATVSVHAEASEERVWDGIRPLPAATPSWASKGDDEPADYAETLRENPEIYGGGLFPSAPAEAGDAAMLRYVRAVPVVVHPARWNATTGELRVARRVIVDIRFERGGMRSAGIAVERDDETWERTLDRTVLNPIQARNWMRAPSAPRGVHRAEALAPSVKFEIRSSGPCKVEFSDLAAAGWNPEGQPISDLWLTERFYDSNDSAPEDTVEVPILVVDADESATWTEGDAIYFYGQTIYDRLPDGPWYLKRYGRMHAYWLGVRAGRVNARMEAVSSWLGASDLTPVESYPWMAHFEKEGDVYMKPGAVVDTETPEYMVHGVATVRSKHVYWHGGQPYTEGDAGVYRAAFDLPGYLSPLGLTAAFQGTVTDGGIHTMALYLSPGGLSEAVALPRTPFSFGNQDRGTYQASAADLTGLPLAASGNGLINTSPPGASGGALVSFDVSYVRAPRFVDNRIEIATSDRTGRTEYRLTQPPQDDLIAIDWTDPRAPKAIVIDPATQIEGVGPSRRLRLQFDLTGDDRRFDILAAGAVPKPSAIALRGATDLLAQGPADYIMVIPRAWIATAQPLIDQRSAQGHTVLVAPIEDVFDQFSGGRHWPHAIRSFMRAMFRTYMPGPSYLCLVGDASEVFDNPLTDEATGGRISAPDWVPTQTMFSQSYSTQGPELITTDQWFVDNLLGTGEDLNFLPDMHVGRLPVGDTTELERTVAKILAYETFSSEDAWRNRALFVGDDVWSNRIAFGGEAYAPHLGLQDEGIFALAGRESMELIAEHGPQCGFAADSFSVGAYMDTVSALGRCARRDPVTGRCIQYNSSADWLANFTYGGSTVRDLLLQSMGRGHLIVTYTGHANARLMSHEYIFRHSPLSGREDVGLLSNLGRPFLFMGFGCHLNEFASYNEALPQRGDGIGENLLIYGYDPPTTGPEDVRAGIGSIASSGYEWIPTSDVYCLALMRSFFASPPEADGHTRWVLGEILSASKRDMVVAGAYSLAYKSMAVTYGLFGDPGLVMDAAPPSISATVDGAPAPGGQPLVLPFGRDSIDIGVRVCDEIWARNLEIHDAGGTAAPDSMIPGGDDRHFRAVYRTTVLPRPYDIVLSAQDATGRTSTLTFPVQLDAAFQIRKPGSDWVALDDGARVLPEDSVRVTVDAPRYLASGDLEMLVGGSVAQIAAHPLDPIEGRARSWRVNLLDAIHAGGEIVLSFGVRQPDGGAYRVERRVQTELEHQILELYNVPNPFSDRTSFFYLLGEPATRVTIKIYTTSGKLIRMLDNLPSRQLQADPPVDWDGTDSDGDPIGNGLYFYKLFVETSRGSLTRIEKLARVR